MNKYINLTEENIDNEHICCAIGDKKHQAGVQSKKNWIKERIKEGHIFRKLDAQGKIFIEFAPLETALCSVNGENFLYIYCLWVAGSFKGKGYARELLDYTIDYAKEHKKSGICVISSKKKKPFLSERSFFEKFGFKTVDTAGDYELLALTFDKNVPSFTQSAKSFAISGRELTIFYSTQCPFTTNCIKELTEYSKEKNIAIIFNEVNSLERAKNVPCVFNNWATFLNGKYVNNILLNKNSVDKLLKKSV